MEFEYKGGNCVTISTKGVSLVIDPKLSHIGLKDVLPKQAFVIATHADFVVPSEGVVVDQPGEYEIKNVSIVGVPAKRMIDHDESNHATMYRISIGGTSIAVIGHVTTPLLEEQLEGLGVIDIAIIPVGGSGYTLDAHQAVAIVRQLDPKVVIPTHYAEKGVNYEVPQMELGPFLAELSAQHEELPKWKVKNDILPEILTVMELTRTRSLVD